METEDDEDEKDELRRMISRANSKLAELRSKEVAPAIARGRTNINQGKITNFHIQNVQIINQTRGRSRSRGRGKSGTRGTSRSKSKNRLNWKKVKEDPSEMESFDDAEADEKLSVFLQELNMFQYAKYFALNEMGYDDLEKITNDRLKDIGVSKLKHRDIILDAIKERILISSGDDNKSLFNVEAKSSSYILDDDVVQMLENLKLTHLKDIFMEEELDMNLIAKMTDTNLKTIGIQKFKHRKMILDAVSDIESKKSTKQQSTEEHSTSSSSPFTYPSTNISALSASSQQVYSKSSISSKPASAIKSLIPAVSSDSVRSSSSTKKETSNFLIVSSGQGDAADVFGGLFGLYKCVGQFNGRQYYQQLDNDDDGAYLFHVTSGHWMISDVLKDPPYYIFLRTRGVTDSPTGAVWQYNSDFHGISRDFLDDSSLTVSDNIPTSCDTITISFSSPGDMMKPQCLGQYKPTNKYRYGRMVCKHVTQQFYLWCGIRRWVVSSQVGRGPYYMKSGCCNSQCAADIRSSYNNARDGYKCKTWRYRNKNGNEVEGNIVVKCDHALN